MLIVLMIVYFTHINAVDYRGEMRRLIQSIADTATAKNSSFIIIPQNAAALLYRSDSGFIQEFSMKISAIGHEPLFSGMSNKVIANDVAVLKSIHQSGLPVWIIDYAATHAEAKRYIKRAREQSFIPFTASSRMLDTIPEHSKKLFKWNDNDCTTLADVQNFLYIINPQHYKTIDAFADAIRSTDFDAVVVDAFFGSLPLDPDTVKSLKKKHSGKRRLVLAYMSIGEAEDYRYYWKKEWHMTNPSWIVDENSRWKGNYRVKYWNQTWHDIVYAQKGSYLDIILENGFDGVYLDVVDAFMRFETEGI